jgi:hypothetical protein
VQNTPISVPGARIRVFRTPYEKRTQTPQKGLSLEGFRGGGLRTSSLGLGGMKPLRKPTTHAWVAAVACNRGGGAARGPGIGGRAITSRRCATPVASNRGHPGHAGSRHETGHRGHGDEFHRGHLITTPKSIMSQGTGLAALAIAFRSCDLSRISLRSAPSPPAVRSSDSPHPHPFASLVRIPRPFFRTTPPPLYDDLVVETCADSHGPPSSR